ncbi:hypothetical protein [Tardiphaga sp.]|uniref:glycoside hydrolase family 113 n=1 Tax=Tardiphaga sp. TaxID=1926292 RepID=UPI0025E7129A|nr:hypothetical protein [Tardiphaga sp.]
MAGIFQVQGFGALSEYNGQFSTASAAQSFQTLASLGSNSVALTVRIWTDNKTGSTVMAHPAKTESDASLLSGFAAAHAAGLSVLFKPGITGLDSTISSSLTPADVNAFFASYTAEIVHLATIAQQGGVETFAIGNEMSKLSGALYLGQWTDMIAQVRAVYHGELTYAAATDEASHVSFWSQLDTIGVNTYPPLTASTTPTVADMVQAWNEVPTNTYYANVFNYLSPVDFLHSLSERYDRPVLITEVGYRSIDGSAIRPGSASGTVIDTAEQADAFNAFFQVWTAEGGSWMKGVELWQWDLNNKYNAAGYSVMGKPAEAIVSQYFHGGGAVPDLVVAGSSIADSIDIGRGNDTIHGGLGDDVIRGGAGNDIIVGGPDTLASLVTTTLTITGYGSVVGGVGAIAQVLVNGVVVSGLMQFKPATDPSGYQTFTVTFNNPAQIDSVAIELTNSVSGRALHIKDFEINGVALTPAQATNASSPGSFDLYVRTIHFNTTAHQDWFVGAATDDDVITGGGGNDTIDGGAGTDTAVFSGNVTDYNISFNGRTMVVTDRVSGRDGSDSITNVELLKFANAQLGADQIIPAASTPAAGDFYRIQSVDGAGNVTAESVNHADGTRDVYTTTVVGQGIQAGAVAAHSYISQHVSIDTTGHTTLIERFAADGGVAFRQVLSGDGSVNQFEYDAGGHLTRFSTAHPDGSLHQATFNATFYQTSEMTRYADGSRDITDYQLVGRAYTTLHTLTDSTGHSMLSEGFRADGSMVMRQTVDAAGVRLLDQYDSHGHLIQQTLMQPDGAYTQSAFAANGDLASLTDRHADGSRSIDSYDITGKAYTSEHVERDAAGVTVLLEGFHADGTLAVKQVIDAGGIRTLGQYDSAGHLSQQTVMQKDGSFVQSTYAADGTLTSDIARHVDGTRDVDTFGITGQSYSARHDDLSATGARLSTVYDNIDGSHTMTAYAAGVTLTSTAARDIMNSAGGDTFVFNTIGGHDVINHFRVGEGAAHDTIEISTSVAVDLAHLSVQVVGHDTLIDFGHDASITLVGVVTPLTSHDVLFV